MCAICSSDTVASKPGVRSALGSGEVVNKVRTSSDRAAANGSVRALVVAAAAAGAIAGAVIGVAPVASAGPPNANCTEANADCVYANCAEAKEAGVCDIPQDDPAYCAKQDRDGDGVACECVDW
jgi:Excalibur calcium-binding domain